MWRMINKPRSALIIPVALFLVVSAVFAESNSPLSLEILTPATDSVLVGLAEHYFIEWTLFDPDHDNDSYSVYIFQTTDTSGWSDNPAVLWDWNEVEHGFDFDEGGYRTHATWNNGANNLVFIGGAAYPNDARELAVYAMAPGSILLYMPTRSDEVHYGEVYDYNLSCIHPNPFNNTMMMEYSLPAAGKVNINAYDLAGRRVAVLFDGEAAAGIYTTDWTPSDLTSGVYLLRLVAGGHSIVRKVVYMP